MFKKKKKEKRIIQRLILKLFYNAFFTDILLSSCGVISNIDLKTILMNNDFLFNTVLGITFTIIISITWFLTLYIKT